MSASVAVLSIALLSACSQQELYAQLNQRQANEMVAVLRADGISAEKVARENNLFAVTVAPDRFSDAVDRLRLNGFPHEGYDTLGQVFKKEGFVSSPLEERARLMHALSQEIANTLSSIDGVMVARVHLSVPEKDPLAEQAPPAAASVFIKHRAGVDLNDQVGHIKALVVNAIQGLAYEKVTVALFAAELVPTTRSTAISAPLSNGVMVAMWITVAGLLIGAAGLALRLLHRRPMRSSTGQIVVRKESME